MKNLDRKYVYEHIDELEVAMLDKLFDFEVHEGKVRRFVKGTRTILDERDILA